MDGWQWTILASPDALQLFDTQSILLDRAVNLGILRRHLSGFKADARTESHL